MKNYMKFGLLSAIILGTLGWLAFTGASENQSYFKSIPELYAMGDKAREKRIRVGGDVVPGSIKREGRDVHFAMSWEGKTLNVVYNGTQPLPDTFKDGSQALADGRLGQDGVFHANGVQAKCASKYEAKAPKMKQSHEASTPSKI